MNEASPVFKMKRLLLPIAILSLISGCASTQIAIKNNTNFIKYKKIYLIKTKEDPRNVITKVAQHLNKIGFEVIMVEDDEPVGGVQSSGFIISEDGYLLTVAHALNKKDKATVWVNGKRYEAELIYKEESPEEPKEDSKKSNKSTREKMEASLNSKDNQSIYEYLNKKDLALLKIKTDNTNVKFDPLIFAKDPTYKMGSEIYTIGFPLSYILGDSPRLNKGLISSSVGPKDSPNYLQVSAEMQPGNSGGPLLNADGQVIGIIQMTLNPMSVVENTGGNLPQNVNFAIKNSVISDFLKNCEAKVKISIKHNGSMDFEKVRESIAQVRSGIIPADFKDQAKLICSVAYQSFLDMWFRFLYLDVIFYDLDSQEVLLRAGQYGDNPFSSEDGTLKKTFEDIEAKLRR